MTYTLGSQNQNEREDLYSSKWSGCRIRKSILCASSLFGREKKINCFKKKIKQFSNSVISPSFLIIRPIHPGTHIRTRVLFLYDDNVFSRDRKGMF